MRHYGDLFHSHVSLSMNCSQFPQKYTQEQSCKIVFKRTVHHLSTFWDRKEGGWTGNAQIGARRRKNNLFGGIFKLFAELFLLITSSSMIWFFVLFFYIPPIYLVQRKLCSVLKSPDLKKEVLKITSECLLSVECAVLYSTKAWAKV